MPVSQSPEIVPALDETRPQIGPNLAGDLDFGRDTWDYIYREYLYPQIIQQQPLLPVWKRIDDAWRVKGDSSDLDISLSDPIRISTDPARKGKGGITDPNDGYSSRVYPPTMHKQITALTDLMLSIAWDQGLPVRVEKDPTEFEHPLYNPVAQSVAAQNELLDRCAREIELERFDRISRGCYAKYGFTMVHTDFEYELSDEPQSFLIPPDPNLANQMAIDLSQRFGGPPTVQGNVATWVQRTVKTMRQRFQPLRHDDVYIDITLPADMNRQLCPTVRSRVTRADLFGRDYDPDKNPFGYLNTQMALGNSVDQWTFDLSNTNFREELGKKWGLSETGIIRQKNALKYRWTAYPMLAIYQDAATGKNMLDKGDGVQCPTCQWAGKVTAQPPNPGPQLAADAYGNPVAVPSPDPDPITNTCPGCNGLMKTFIKPERYVVEVFGNLTGNSNNANASATVLRIQRNPTVKDRVPILFSAQLPEDTAGAYPLSKAEAALKSADQEATCLNQWFDAKNALINPPWAVPADSPNRNKDLNRPNANITYETNPDENQPLRMQLDPTQNILPIQQKFQGDQQEIMGANDTLLGQIQSGRRSASEIQNAYDSSKAPIVISVDQYNRDILGNWAQMFLDSMEAFADRAWIQKVTGRTTFGKVRLFTSVAAEFMKRQAAIGNYQYLIQVASQRPEANITPLMDAVGGLMKLDVNMDEVFPDGGVKKARADGMRIVTQILGQGQLMPPAPQDPHAIYIEIFEQALQDPYWQEKTPETMPLLQQRLMMQLQLQMQQQMAQMKAQQQQLLASQPSPKGKDGGGNGNQPDLPNIPPATVGGQNQQTMGAAQ